MRYFYIKVVSASMLVMFTCLASAKEKLEISYGKELLSVKADNVTLKRLCEEIARKTNVEIVLLDKVIENQNVAVEFNGLSLKDGIGKVIVATGIENMACSLFERSVFDCQNMKFGHRLTQIGIGKGDAVLRHYKSLEKSKKSPPLIEGLDEVLAIARDKSANKSERVREITKISLMRPKSARITIEGLVRNDKDPDIRILALMTLGSIGDVASIPVLKGALKDKEKRVQLTAAHVLGCFYDSSGYDLVKGLIHDSSLGIRGYAISILGVIGKEEDKILIEEAMRDDNRYVQTSAEIAQMEMGIKGTKDRIGFLKRVLDKSSRDEIQEWAVKRLSGESEDGIKALEEIAENPNSRGSSFAQMELKLIDMRKELEVGGEE